MHRAILLSIALTCLVAACTLAPEPAPPPLAPGLARQTQTIEGLRLLLDHPDDAQTLQEQRMQIWLQDGRGHPVSGAEVRLDLAMPMLCASGDAPAATEIAPGSYEATTTYVMSGSWTVTVSVLRDGARSAASFPVQVREDPTQALINPYAADLAAAELGAQIYAGSCASCHGDGGRGDGPAAAGLQPPPADLSAHLAPGKHSDGEIFRWIRDGIAGSAMPAFGATLSEEQRWQLISFLRTMPGAAPAEVSGPLPPAILIRAGNLYRSDGSGQPPQPVSGTSALGSFSGLALAPDGRQLAVIARRPSTVTETGRLVVPVLYSMNPDGSEPRPLWEALDQELAHPAWTPDGAAVVVTAQAFTPIGDGGGYLDIPTLVRVELATGARTTLATNAQSPALSPDGTLLAFTQRDEVTNEIRLMLAQADGGDVRSLVADRRFQEIAAPRFSPDGALIVFAAAAGPPVDAEGWPVAAQEPSLLDRALALFEPPTASAHVGNWEIWSVRSDGSELRQLTRLATHDLSAVFSPDGAQLLVASELGIHLMGRDGGELQLLDATMAREGVAWLPAR